ncbi:ribonuclease E inhibitor RraB [Antarcticibacterium arcticum]|uniref:ribonuclease E inhibitor RraB n=1 Tax=Antarcticibacterium arcticum TaxID=2585771 RepID=UPI00143CE816|nr:ribonuclease E inhibitor RraB [Antarcticibacterium arcticum]
MNRIVIKLFKTYGGRLTKKRPITHWFYFREKEDLLKFEIHMSQIGFSTHFKELTRKTSKEKLLLIVERNEKLNLDFINFDTEEFQSTARKYRGRI